MTDTWANTSLLRSRRDRAIAIFPDLAQCGHELFAFMGVYADQLPWCTYDRQAQFQYLAFLRTLQATRPKFLPDFLRNENGTIEVAFRTLETINRTFAHDRDWLKLGDVQLLRTIHAEAHPAYLQLCEGVLKWLLAIVALSRGAPIDKMSPNDLAKEARNAGIHPLACFDSTMRNAIAHGSIAFDIDRIEYLNRYKGKIFPPRVNTPQQTLAMLEALLDVCNGIAAALRIFVLLDRDLLFSRSVQVPPALVFPEVNTQLVTAGWRVDDYLGLRDAKGSRELTLFARTTYLDDHKTQLSVIRTATFAAGLMPGFDRYLVQLDRGGQRAGWGRFDGAKVHELMAQGLDYAPAYLEATQPGDFFVPPALGRFHIPARLRVFGSIAEVIRTSWVTRHADRPIDVRHVEISSKRTYVLVTAHVVLHRSDIATAVVLTRSNVRRIIRMAIRAARAVPQTTWWLRLLPVGYVQIYVYLEDRRRRELLANAWGPNMICRLTRKTRGRIPVGAPPEAMAEIISGVRVDWNGPVIEPLLQFPAAGDTA